MIPETTNANQIDTTVSGERIQMGIEQAAMGHIMNVLTNLYSDEELACIREYATNALDSHVAAGQSRPIEVSLPTDLRPILSIRDFGVGLSAEEIETIYSQYGKSTKRGTNDAVGMLGLGCKSALAYVDQFTLISIKDGERITVSIARDAEGIGGMVINSREPCDDHPGVEVLIPAKAYNSFERKAEEFFRWWEPGTVLVDGEAPEAVEGWQIDEEFSVIDKPTAYDRKLRLVMGNVSYPISHDYELHSKALQGLPEGKQIVVRVPIGMIAFTPSREALAEHPATTAALDQILATFQQAARAAIRSQILEATDKPRAAKTLIAARDALGAVNVPPITYRGELVPTVLSAEDLKGGRSLWKNTPQGGASRRSAAGQVALDDAAAHPWIVNYTNQSWSKTQRQKFNRYLEEHHADLENPRREPVYITDADAVPLPEWIDGNVLAINWADVREWKDPKTAAEGGVSAEKYAGTYPTWMAAEDDPERNWRRERFPADSLPKSGELLYWCRDNEAAGMLRRALGPAAIVVNLRDARRAKFLRLFPHAREARAVLRQRAGHWWAKLDEDSALAVLVGNHAEAIADFENIHAEDVDDSELSEALFALNRWNADTVLQRKFSRFSPYLNTEDEADSVVRECERIASKYPLVESLGFVSAQHYSHITLYINAAYAAGKR